jgi:hypothetical protein
VKGFIPLIQIGSLSLISPIGLVDQVFGFSLSANKKALY